jgi:hypothetical protein
MSSMYPPGRTSSDPGSDSNSRERDRFENEGGVGPADVCDPGLDAQAVGRVVTDPETVVLTPGSTAGAFQVHHRDIPD